MSIHIVLATPVRLMRRVFISCLAAGLLAASLSTSQAQLGIAHSWGYDFHGELGTGGNVGNRVPQTVLSINGVTRVAGGGDHSLLLKSSGKVFACGFNLSGQLGDGTTIDKKKPVLVSGITNAVQIAAGADQSYALLADGTVRAWGRNDSGQLGDGTGINSSVPVTVSGLTKVVQIAAGHDCGIALKSDGTAWAWGYNGNGQIGDGTGTNRNSPVQVAGLTNVVQVAGSWSHMLALKSDGTVWAWGINADGQLGDGTNQNKFTPVQVVGITNAIQIAGGGLHSLALLSNGFVMAWGNNINGSLGDGTQVSRNTPALVPGISDVVQIAEGLYHSQALKSDGSLWAWGYNVEGQAGLGSDKDIIFEPTPLTALKGQTCVSSGALHTLSVQAVVQSVKLSPANMTTSFGKPIVISATLKSASGMLLPLEPIVFVVDGVDAGIARTNAAGKASLPLPLAQFGSVGTHAISVSFAGDGLYSLSRGVTTYTVNKANTSIKTSAFVGRPGDTKTLTATLKRLTDSAMLSGMALTFKIDGNAVGSATTDGMGKASLPYKFTEALSATSHALTVEFAGDGNHNASTGAGTLTVIQAPTKLSSYSASGKAGATVSLIAKLKRATDGQFVANRQLTFSIDGAVVGLATTDNAGQATLSYGIPLGTTKGAHPITVLFGGDTLYLGSSAASAVLSVK